MLNVLVFPCGSEIGLEIHRSLKYSTHVNLYGGNSVDDHGKFVYENYIAGLPFFNQPDFLDVLKKTIRRLEIDALYPAMDGVMSFLSGKDDELGCKIIGSPRETNEICLSKLRTYQHLEGVIPLPRVYEDLFRSAFPVFMKPEIGYGSRGAKMIRDARQGEEHLKQFPDCIILENLPGREFTVDCFTDRNGHLIFSGPRERRRVMNGISVNTVPVQERQEEFQQIAQRINEKITFRGAWFFQVKENTCGELALLEVASRLGGSSSLFRNLGVNFALLSIFDAFDYNVELFLNEYEIELDRALNNKYKVNIDYQKVYVDFDDCVLCSARVNTELIGFLFQVVNEGKQLILITKHERDIQQTLEQMRLTQVFDEVIHLSREDQKWKFMDGKGSIFIDDSFAERKEVHQHLRIPVFAPDAVECLIK